MVERASPMSRTVEVMMKIFFDSDGFLYQLKVPQGQKKSQKKVMENYYKSILTTILRHFDAKKKEKEKISAQENV